MANVAELNEKDFDAEVLQSSVPVLVDFWAPWCAPCRAITPLIEELSRDNAGEVKVVKVNVDDSRNLAMTYEVFNIPTLLVFKGGEVVDRMVGIPPKTRLQNALNEAKG